ncbi:response regulator [Desulfurispira natronophila]|uniref:CheY-like chemotaxis protein n=1 Tax=Desulfurispira natronophila TaxID=682562 RepID=A0A7W7Y5U3_9BACT|nr:response regulator [Desulfurispira natronophila]MBB5022362.1 CheY-like chemotaxis protein [Desulfurispira natronophila]
MTVTVSASQSNLKQASILYVEDDPVTLKTVGRMMSRRAREVYLASNGHEGLQLVQSGEALPDIVVTDVEMPVMNGLEMVRRLREECRYTNPVIILTAYRDDEHRSSLANTHLYKPVNAAKLFAAMEELYQKG